MDILNKKQTKTIQKKEINKSALKLKQNESGKI